MNRFKKFLSLLLSALLAIPAPAAYSAFDPVNDDTDIFLSNPNIPESLPNVLIVVDNTANWNNQFADEQAALSQTVKALPSGPPIRVGMMMFSQNDTAGGGGPNIDGAQLRFAIREMTAGENEAPDGTKGVAKRLNAIVDGWVNETFPLGGDKADKNLVGLAMLEAYRYYAGKPSLASWPRVKTDKNAPLDTKLNHAVLNALENNSAFQRGLPGNPNAATNYRSPITDGCQKNFIIFISNGPANENDQDREVLRGELQSIGADTTTIQHLAPNDQQQGNWADEMARFMATSDVYAGLAGPQNVFTYTLEINPNAGTLQGRSMTELLKSMGKVGKGDYLSAVGGDGGADIVEKLKQIFTAINAVNTVFAASSLPVSVNVRGTNLDQVYIGVFRPDAQKKPRWLGNLKMYQLLSPADSAPFLADLQGDVATATTGFIDQNATSFWTATSSFWNFRTPGENGVGGESDSPDGDLVEKGGAAQRIREVYKDAEGAPVRRRVYTCTTPDGITGCIPGTSADLATLSTLSATPFDVTNNEITADALALGKRAVSPLTAFNTKSVTSLTDRRDVSITNADSPKPVTKFVNNGSTVQVKTLDTKVTKTVTSLTAANNIPLTFNLVNVTRSGGTCTATASGDLPATLGIDTSVSFSGISPPGSALNGTSKTVGGVNFPLRQFTFNCPGGSAGTGGTATVQTSPGTTAKATVTAHGFQVDQLVTIEFASPSQFNVTNAPIRSVTTDTFTYDIATEAGAATGAIKATVGSFTANVVTTAAHLFANNSTVAIHRATPTGYNLTRQISVTSPDSFTYCIIGGTPPACTSGPVDTILPPADTTTNPVYAVNGGSTTVTVTAPGHGFPNGTQVTIGGSDIFKSDNTGYNGTWRITFIDVDTFSFDTAVDNVAPTVAITQVLPLPAGFDYTNVNASSGTVATVTATLPGHRFATGDNIVIDGAAPHAGPWGPITLDPVDPTNKFSYSTVAALTPPAGAFTVRHRDTHTAFMRVPGHGFGAAGATVEILVQGALPLEYDGTKSTAKVIDADNLTYSLAAPQGPNTGSPVTASMKTNTARGTAIAHGFGNLSTVTISGANPTAFNGPFTVTVTGLNTFEYTIPGLPQGDATGTIIAEQGSGPAGDRDQLIRWVRGEDNFENENSNGATTDIRASVHGDVLHSRPAVVNYNRFGGNNDVYVFYGSNDGVFHAIKGGFGIDPSDPNTLVLAPGDEAWGFIPSEFFGKLNRLRKGPAISSSFKRPYFADGSIGVFAFDANTNGQLGDHADDRVHLYVSMRRGGQFLYAIDVTDPITPKFLWKIDNTDATGFAELGQTWSQPTLVRSLAGLPYPVLIFGAGYDPAAEDIDPATVQSNDASGVTTPSGFTPRTMGRGVYIVNALTGKLVWRAKRSGDTSTLPLGASETEVTGMDFAIPSDVTVVRNLSGLPTNRAYVGDLGGNVWRLNFSFNAGTNTFTGTVTKLAILADQADPSARRKIFFPPDVVRDPSNTFDAVLVGTGDREHPFEGVVGTSVKNEFYMLKDEGLDGPATTGTGAPGSGVNETLTKSALVDLTTDCIQDASACGAGQTPEDVQTALNSKSGWFITLQTAEKVINAPLAVGGVVFFGTNLPPGSPEAGQCAQLGPARLYRVHIADATAVVENPISGTPGLTSADRWEEAGQGLLPSSQYVITESKKDTILTGPITSQPPTVSLSARLRKFWYKEVDR